jgi:hypothetical protein
LGSGDRHVCVARKIAVNLDCVDNTPIHALVGVKFAG